MFINTYSNHYQQTIDHFHGAYAFLSNFYPSGYITGATGMQIMRLLSRHKRHFPLKNSFNLPN